MPAQLAGRVAIVTGASSGIGRATAKMLAACGASVVVNHFPSETARADARSVVEEICRKSGNAIAIAADIGSESDVLDMFAEAIKRFGKLDILVNNAGIERPSPIQDMSLADWTAVIRVNMTGQFLCTREAVRIFLAQKQRGVAAAAAGNIIFVSSVHQRIPWAFQANYAASKGGVSLFMASLAQELAPARIRVNAVAPGAIRTPINREAWQDPAALAGLLSLIPYGRIGEPADVADAIAWLASDASDYVVGTTLFVDGGMTLFPAFRGNG
jgi:glucose 1-dehydrogenase